MVRRLYGALVALIICLGLAASPGDDAAHRLDSLALSLRNAQSAADSVDILFNILDMAVTPDARAVASKQLYNAACNAGDTIVQLDAIMYKANVMRNDSTYLAYLHGILDKMPSTARIDEIKLYIDMLQIENSLANNPGIETDGQLSKLIQQYLKTPPASDYDQARLLFTICTRLTKQTRGSLLEKYADKLCSLLQDMNMPAGAVRYYIYLKGAQVFSENENPSLAVETDKRTLAIIDSLNTTFEARGRKIHALDEDTYICCRRLLLNYTALTPAEIEVYYNEIIELVNRDPALREKFEKNYAIGVFYSMAKKDYRTAISKIVKGIDLPVNAPYRYHFLNFLVEAAKATGQRDLQLDASLKLNDILKKRIEEKGVERTREVQIIYDINALQEENARLEAEKHQAKLKSNRILIIVSGVGLLLLLAMIGVLWRQNVKVKRLANENAESARHILAERNELRNAQQELIEARDSAKNAERLKSDFINSMSHEIKTPLSAISEYSRLIVECIPDERRKYLDRFAGIIELNTQMVLTFMNDVLDISALESDTMRINKEPVNVYDICGLAVNNVFEDGKSVNPDVAVVFNPSEKPDILVTTDGQRVAQVLVNLLSNADKFTERGKIVLDYDLSPDGKELTFTVSDTGQGIPPGKEKVIFDRFLQLDHSAGGSGLGLYISSLIAKLLGGTISVDTSYRRGARFIFTIPV